jgi:hypothetical protein
MNRRKVIADLLDMGRRQEAAKTATIQPVTLFQVADYVVQHLPDELEPSDDASYFKPELGLGESPSELWPSWMVEAWRHIPRAAEDGFDLAPADMFHLGITAGRWDTPCAAQSWRTLTVFGTVEEARRFGENTKHRYSHHGQLCPKGEGHEWRAYTVPSGGLLGHVVGWAIDEAILTGKGGKA